jgi:hypothetical protein
MGLLHLKIQNKSLNNKNYANRLMSAPLDKMVIGKIGGESVDPYLPQRFAKKERL